MWFFELFNLMVLTILYILLLNHSLTMYQQYHYDTKKYIKTIPKLYSCNKLMWFIYFVTILSLITNPYLTIVNLILCLIMVIKPPKYIIKLNITKRILRLILTYIICLILLLFIPLNYYYTFILVNLFIPLLIIGCNYINHPIEKLINNYYIKQAKTKLLQNKSLIKIAITGSYGKTTTKNIITHILKDDYLTVATPKSYNTLLGITKTINDSIKPNSEIFVCELGTNHLGEIREMSHFLRPHIACITEVGPQHLETFKTIDNVLKAKFEITETMGFNKSLILNGDNSLIKNKQIITIRDISYVGINEDNNIYAKDINLYKDNITFVIVCGDENLKIETKLLGIHNVYNILIAYGVVRALRKYNIFISNDDFCKKIKQLPPVPHRLEYKEIENIHIYDDSYNSNLSGFKNAIDIMKLTTHPRVIITPGIVDAGKLSEEINTNIAGKLLNNFDDIYLVKNKMSVYYQQVLDKNKQPYYTFDSFSEAFNHFKNKYKNKEVNLLIENDLPDNFLER